MILQRPQCLALFFVWFVTFFLMWKLFCKVEIATSHNRSPQRNGKLDGIVEAPSRINKRHLVRQSKNVSSPFKSLQNVFSIKALLSEDDRVDVKKELKKLKDRYSCKPVNSILFIKTHKTGSSTITNILNRYGDLRELTVAIPAGGDYRFQWPRRFHWTFVDFPRLDGETANIFSNHARYNRKEMDFIMKKDTKYITILREPVSQYVSSFYYFEIDRILGLQHRKDPLEEFLKNPDRHLFSLSIRNGDIPDVANLMQSGMMYDLGYDFLEFVNKSLLMNAIQRLDSELDLVLMLEYFDESLVLMMREFCWDFDDVLYIKMNAMKYKRSKISNRSRKKILKLNEADVALYSHFNRTFWKRIKKYGNEFWEDVAEFRKRNAEMLAICSPREIEEKAFRINVTIKGLVMGRKVGRFHRPYCKKLMMNEVQYLDYFRYKFGKSYGYQKILRQEGDAAEKTRELMDRLKMLRKNNYLIR